MFERLQFDFDATVWSNDILGIEVLYLGVQSVLYVLLAILIDRLSTKPSVARMWNSITSCKCFCGSKTNAFRRLEENEIDQDVAAEIERVQTGADNDLIVLQNQMSLSILGNPLVTLKVWQILIIACVF